jgi:hypothetical protein
MEATKRNSAFELEDVGLASDKIEQRLSEPQLVAVLSKACSLSSSSSLNVLKHDITAKFVSPSSFTFSFENCQYRILNKAGVHNNEQYSGPCKPEKSHLVSKLM